MTAMRAMNGWRRLPHPIRWVAAAIVGGTLIVVGIVLLVLPGPGLVLIALGLAVLASEFAWAEALLHRAKQHGSSISRAVRRRKDDSAPDAEPPVSGH